ncbi:unnamed protein product [Amoebophrya sp. A25]|nr:unnamed protein product [Amoebophrya sp. A25]|eukprot:GSA25T00016564001.1
MRLLQLVCGLLAASIAQAQQMQAPVATPEQRDEYLRDFKEFDSNGDQYLDTQEVRGNFKGEVADPELWEFYKMADKDLDGKVSQEEYIKYAADLSYQSEDGVTKEDL